MNLVMQETEPYTGHVIKRRGAATNLGICERDRIRRIKKKVSGRNKKRCGETMSEIGTRGKGQHACAGP